MATIISESFVSVGTQIASSATAYATTTSVEKIIIDKALFFNTNSTVEVVKGYVETSGTTPGANDQVFEVSILAGEHLDCVEAANIRLDKSQSLLLLTTTASKVNLHLSGRRIAS